jgi:hypothetical protein
MKSTKSFTLAWQCVCALMVSCSIHSHSHGAINDWFFEKIIDHTQTTDGQNPTIESTWQVEIAIEVEHAGDATGGSISGGGIDGSLPLTWDDGEWLLEKQYNSKADLDAEFPSNASYSITLSGGTLGTIIQTLTFPAEDYPNAPHLTGTVFSDLASVDRTSDFDLTWGATNSDSWLFIEISQADTDLVEDELGPNTLSYTIPANTFNTVGTFTGNLLFANSVAVTATGNGFGVNGSLAHTKSLTFDINTVESGPEPAVVEWELEKGAIYEQESDDTQPSTVDTWFFFVEVETANSDDATAAVLTGSSIDGSIPLTKEGDTSWTLDQEFADESALNTAHPIGATYTIELSGGALGPVSQAVTFSSLSAPNTPYLTGSDFSRIRSIDAEADFDFHWNDPGDANYVEIEFYHDDVYVEANSEGATTGTLQANSLNPGHCYPTELFFANEQSVSGTDGFGVDGWIINSRITDLNTFTVLSNNVDAIVGAWQFGDGVSNASGVLVFQANGTYFHAEDIVADSSETDGMERGTYTWDADSGQLTATPDTDTNGDIGLSDPIGSFTATVSGDTLTISDTDSTTLQRVNDPDDHIVGGWRICDNAHSDTGVLVFLDNGTYFHAEVDTATGSGMERGTYNWSSSTETLTINSTAVDTNHEIGLGGDSTLTVFTSGRKVLTIEDGEDTHLYRVSNAAVLPNWRLSKSRDFRQTVDNTQPTTATEWNIWGLVELRNANDATAITLSGEDGSGTPFSVNYVEDEPGEWTLDLESYESEALLNADYPNNQDFTITLSGGELGTLTQTIQTSDNYPTIPYLTGSVLSDASGVNPTEAFELGWNSHPSASVQLVITSQPDEEGEEYFEQTELITDLTSMTLPAGTIPAGGDAYGFLFFNTVTDTNDGSGGFGADGFSANHSTLLDFPISAVSTNGIIDAAFTDAGLTTTEDQALDATPFNDGVENLLKYAFNMNLNAPDSSTLEDGGNSGLPASGIKEVNGQTVWQVEYVRPKGSGLIYSPKKTGSLDQAFEPMVGSESIEDLGNGLERVTISEPCDPTTTPSCFSIVEVSTPAQN